MKLTRRSRKFQQYRLLFVTLLYSIMLIYIFFHYFYTVVDMVAAQFSFANQQIVHLYICVSVCLCVRVYLWNVAATILHFVAHFIIGVYSFTIFNENTTSYCCNYYYNGVDHIQIYRLLDVIYSQTCKYHTTSLSSIALIHVYCMKFVCAVLQCTRNKTSVERNSIAQTPMQIATDWMTNLQLSNFIFILFICILFSWLLAV